MCFCQHPLARVAHRRAQCKVNLLCVREAVVMSPDVTRVNPDRNIHYALGAGAAVSLKPFNHHQCCHHRHTQLSVPTRGCGPQLKKLDVRSACLGLLGPFFVSIAGITCLRTLQAWAKKQAEAQISPSGVTSLRTRAT